VQTTRPSLVQYSPAGDITRCDIRNQSPNQQPSSSNSTNSKSQLNRPKLSPRESEVLNFVLKGYSSAEAAEALFCSKRTVDFHLYRAYLKLGVKNRIQALQRAVELGIVKF
jgi:DNA-binding CsgD family transcriptional regulator